MADLSDVTAYFLGQAIAAAYPAGTSQASVGNIDCRIFEGWPIAAQLDLDIQGLKPGSTAAAPIARPGGPCANVSVFPMSGTGAATYQILDQTYTITPPAITTTFALAGNVITVSGTLSPQEFLTLIIDDQVICSQTGANVAAMLAALATQAQAAGYAAVATAATLTVPFGRSLTVRQGGQGLLGKVTHRQKHSVMVSVWAPNRVVRNRLAAAIDVLIKATNKITLPDTSQALVTYSRTNTLDEQQAVTIYRRDLIFDCEYATLETFAGAVITATTISAANFNNSSIITAIAGGAPTISVTPAPSLDFSNANNSEFEPLI